MSNSRARKPTSSAASTRSENKKITRPLTAEYSKKHSAWRRRRIEQQSSPKPSGFTPAAEHTWESLRRLMPRWSDLKAMGRHKRKNLTAGLTVSVVALPLALAFGVSSGMGAASGLATAVIAGALAAVFGGSNLQVSGPTGAMTVVLIPIAHRYGVSGVLTVGLMAGVLLIAMAVARIGKMVRLLPVSLIEGFTLGIAVVIALQQAPALFGVAAGESDRMAILAWEAFSDYLSKPNFIAPFLAVTVLVAIMLGARWRPALPVSLGAVILASVANYFFNLGAPTIGHIPAGLPAPNWGFINFHEIHSLFPAAVAVAALSALESLLCATVADGMSVNERHDPDRELFGQGIANLAVPFFGGVPATAAIARTAVNVRAGASSRLAALSHAVFLGAIAFFVAPLVGHIPLAALAGVLLATTLRMVERASVVALIRSSRGDAVILAATFLVTVTFDLVTAVVVGLAIAAIRGLKSVAESVQLERIPLQSGDFTADEKELLAQHIVAFRLDGPLFFAAAHQFLLELTRVADVKVVILRLSRVTTIDATGAKVLGDAIKRLEDRGITVLLSGIKPGHKRLLNSLGITQRLKQAGRIFEDTPGAIGFAQEILGNQEALKRSE